MTYTEALNVFSPDGRLIQVEYAHHASDQGSLITASTTQGAVILCIEKKTTTKNHIPKSKLLKVSNDIYFSYSGLSSDASAIYNKLLLFYHNFKLKTDTYPNISSLAMELGSIKFKYTIEGGKRPFGARSILFGFEDQSKIFIVEPDGNYGEYKEATLGFKSDKVIFGGKNIQNKKVTLVKEGNPMSVDLTDDVFGDLVKTVCAMSNTIKVDHKKMDSYIITKENCYLVSEENIKEIIE